jgi:LuxR family transcriptional regulator, maltose regulon positive regulatory protein
VHTLVRLGQAETAEQLLAGLAEQDRDHEAIRVADAELLLQRGDPRAATIALAPVLHGPVPAVSRHWVAQAFMLEAGAREALGDSAAAQSAIERALDLAEPNGVLAPFLLYATPALLERHAGRRTAHAALLGEIRSLLSSRDPARPAATPLPPTEPLSGSELRVLRYLPTNLTTHEIARELSVSPNTVKTHIRALYTKLGTRRRAGAVERARALGMLAPSAQAVR